MNLKKLTGFKVSKGFSLVELMIAGFLGLLLLGGIITLFLSSRQTFRVQEQIGNIQADGRFALMFLERFIENAGWYENLAPANPFSAIDFGLSSEGGGNGNDSIAVSMEVAAGTGVDCNGAVVVGTRVTNHFFIDGNTLVCQGNGGAVAWAAPPQPIIENVDSFQVLYGVDTDSDHVVDRYVTADTASGSNWTQKIATVQIGILVTSQDRVLPEPVQRDYQIADLQLTINDQRLRRAFNKTIVIPNQAYAMVYGNLMPKSK